MKRTQLQWRPPFTILAIWVAMSWASGAQAQVETLDPNPTLPYDLSNDFGYGRTNGGAHFGRGPGQPREENPADTMLREIEGTNYGHYTGHVIAGAPRGGRPENRWRYRYYRGRWWYWTGDRRWSYFDGRRWLTHSPG